MSGAAGFERTILIVLDGVGAGAAPDAAAYGDEGANTLGHVAERCGGLFLPHLASLGLGRLLPIAGVPAAEEPIGAFGTMREYSAGKDTTTGHWEMAGVLQEEPLPTFPDGFPAEIIDRFTLETGLVPLGNVAASGTEIIRRFGEEHVRSGRPIVYTSADSVFQVAAHEKVIDVEGLYDICRTARRILDPYRIGRVIARPFIGETAADFKRTARRHDFSLPPSSPTVLDRLVAAGVSVHGVGKVRDIFAGRGISEHLYTESNADGMAKTLKALGGTERGLVFTNLVDFDMAYGHRLDAAGFGSALEAFDRWLPTLQAVMSDEDLLVITADHGCDPTTAGTDHSREVVPLLVWHRRMESGTDLGRRQSFADIGATLADNFGVDCAVGESFLAAVGGRGGASACCAGA